MKSFFLAFVLTVSAGAAEAPKVLLMGDPGTKGQRAVVGELSIRADAITYDEHANELRCAGAVEIRTADNVVKAQECAIQLGQGATVYHMNARGIEITPKQPAKASTVGSAASQGHTDAASNR